MSSMVHCKRSGTPFKYLQEVYILSSQKAQKNNFHWLDELFNKRSELIFKFCHANKFLLCNYWLQSVDRQATLMFIVTPLIYLNLIFKCTLLIIKNPSMASWQLMHFGTFMIYGNSFRHIGHEFNSHSESTLQSYSNFIVCLVIRDFISAIFFVSRHVFILTEISLR